MKITGIRIIGLQQFGDAYLDFTNPETKQPLEKVCFIGQNGTGKSTILRIIYDFLDNNLKIREVQNLSKPIFLLYKTFDFISISITAKINNVQESFYFCAMDKRMRGAYTFVLKGQIDRIENWQQALIHTSKNIDDVLNQDFNAYYIEEDTLEYHSLLNVLNLKNNRNDLLIYCPSESNASTYFQIKDVPGASLNDALKLFTDFSFSHVVSDENIAEFWKLLIYLIKKRDNDRDAFENTPSNINKTKKELIEEFEKISPKILEGLAKEWDKILNKTGLYFDSASASNPIQLNDNLRVYIKHKGTNERINYNQLSTGIRNFIFKIGHIYSLYFNREVKTGFLLFDEPENSLFPDFLFELIKTIQTIVLDKNKENNTQVFISTHNPIVAAQFQPYERLVFTWNEKNQVDIKKGIAPIGDDPNDILSSDFMLTNLMGEEGIRKWNEYLALKKQLARANSENKDELISKINQIGKEYNF